VFLWQQVIIIGVDRFPAWLDVILSIAAGAASYVLVERPFLRLKRRSSIKVGSAGTPPVDLRRTDGLAPAREPV
jgi:peptidoglycan/LPS O-acetylase OafA/YrhL